MPATAAPVAKPFRPQFTLRLLLLAIFLLGIALGIGRWIYVRTILQRQIVMELQQLGSDFGYARVTTVRPTKFHLWFGNETAPLGNVVSEVTLHVPFRSDAEAHRVNRLLGQLPHLCSACIQCSENRPAAEGWDRANRHAAIALGGLQVNDFQYVLHEPNAEIARLIRESPHMREVELFLGAPDIADLQTICQSPHLTSLIIGNADLNQEHFDVLVKARHLRRLSLSGRMPCDRLGCFSQLVDCELELSPWSASDRDLQEVIAKLPNLTALSLSLHEPSDDAVAALAGLPKLRVLGLQDAVVSDAAVVSLANSKSLVLVNLSGTDVSDAAIVQLATCPTLLLLEFPPADRVDRLRTQIPISVKVNYVASDPNAAVLRAQRREEAAKAAAVGTANPMP